MWILDKLISRNYTIKFEEISMEWLELKRNTIKQSTYYKYAYCIEKYLKERLGNLKKKDLERYDYNQMTNELTKELSPKSVKEILNVLKSILKYANQRYGMNIHLDLIISPKVCVKEISVLSKKEVNKLEKYCLTEKNCIKVGMDIKSLSEILGHASVDVTLNRYVHSSYEMKKKFLEKL